MTTAWRDISGDPATGILIIADHASNHVPDHIDLGISSDLMDTHIAIDLGVLGLVDTLCATLNCPAILGNVSRLVIDFNREEDAAGLIPIATDGVGIPGNQLSKKDRSDRIERWWLPYHSRIADVIRVNRPRLLVSAHSFTPKLTTRPEDARPWQIGILYNEDDRAARIAIPSLEAQGLIVGDQEPYSGRQLNATMNSHGEGNGIAYLGIEMRQDEIANEAGIDRWASILAPIITNCLAQIR